VRFALAVLVAALADVVVFRQTSLWFGAGAFLAVAYLMFAALGAGWFAGRLSALAGAASVLLGAEAGGVFLYLTAPRPEEVARADVFALMGWALWTLVWALPYAIGGAFAGAAGGWLRARAMRRV
jgi:hypothetical protein